MIGSHVIPRFYLEQFSTPSKRGKSKPGRLWVYERGKEPSQRATSIQGVRNGYFGYVQPDGSFEESFESDLARLERECNDVLICARSDLFHWPRHSQEKLACYAALLYSRATQRRDSSQKNHIQIVNQMRLASQDRALINDLSQAVSKKIGGEIPKELVLEAITGWLEKAQQPEMSRNAFLSDLLDNARLIANCLLNKKPWRVLRPATGNEFVTSDNPLVTFLPLETEKLVPGFGFNRKEAVAAFPLAPSACLVMGEWHTARTELTPSAHHELTEVFARIADRYVYSRQHSSEVREIVDRIGGTSRYGVNAFIPDVNPPDVRQILRLHFGLDSD